MVAFIQKVFRRDIQENVAPVNPVIVSASLWQKVQEVLASHINGERIREHPHFLKGSLYCKNCGSRRIITYAKSGSGVRYPYFVCAGRHSKREKSCRQKAVLIDVIEEQVRQIYDRYSLPADIRSYLEKWLQAHIEEERKKYDIELDGLRREKGKLERKQKKLLEAHYNDAIPLDLLKSEQQKIAKQLAAIESQVTAHEQTFADILRHLSETLELLEDCGKMYRVADDHIKRMMNQIIFSKLWVGPDGGVTAEFAEPFRTLVNAAQACMDCDKKEETRGTNVSTDHLPLLSRLRVTQNRLSDFFGYCLNNDFLVGITGLEPVTSYV